MENKRQNIVEFFEALQMEYLITEIRRKIYPSASDKRHYEKVMRLKEAKIVDIAVKNSLKSIFSSQEKRTEYITKVYPTKGLPQFGKYLKDQDVINYYSKNAIVKVYSHAEACVDDFVFARVNEYDNRTKIVTLIFDDRSLQTVKSDLVTRIL